MTVDGRVLARSLVAAAIVAGAAMLTSLSTAAIANEIPVMSASQQQAESLSDPTASVWNDASTETIPLSSAPSGAPNENDTSIDRVNVEAARADGTLYVRLSWADGTNDSNVTPSRYEAPRVNAYGDAAGIQIPVETGQQPGIAMGSADSMVNVWWWNGAVGNETLLAGGPGTSTRLGQSTLETNAAYGDGRWTVVYTRDLAADGQNRSALDVNEDVHVAFAVWNGSNAERAGRKSVSEWYHFPFGPEPEGPPYETVLWAIAGVAIGVVVVVTAVAVRRGE